MEQTIRTAVARRGASAGDAVPVGDGQVGQGHAGVAGQVDRLVQARQAPHRAAVVEDAGGLPGDARLGEDRLDDLAHLAVIDDRIRLVVYPQRGAGVRAGDALPAIDGFEDGLASRGDAA
jgi:hypothetical protein